LWPCRDSSDRRGIGLPFVDNSRYTNRRVCQCEEPASSHRKAICHTASPLRDGRGWWIRLVRVHTSALHGPASRIDAEVSMGGFAPVRLRFDVSDDVFEAHDQRVKILAALLTDRRDTVRGFLAQRLAPSARTVGDAA